ncbi:hypothetical protein BJV77DRAFT_353817 [Russula vinacea]|nr:hypothetical protein BJV77DRAFT_139278 [Russula vinacea]KAH9993638.1 hypothetical protein BJV77DRAFT_353817 [Russula vinacea]
MSCASCRLTIVLWGNLVICVQQARLGCRQKGSHGSHPSDECAGRDLELVWIASVKLYVWRRSGCSIAGKTFQTQIDMAYSITTLLTSKIL